MTETSGLIEISGFIKWIVHIRYVGVEITVVISRRRSLCWVLKVSVVESLKLNCLLVRSDSVSSRWGSSLCLEQIVGALVWSGCKCCWRRSMMWTHWLLKLDDRCPGLCSSWLTGCVSMQPRSVGASPSSVVAYGLDSCRYWLQSLCDQCPALFNSWLTRCVLMWLRSVDASPSSESVVFKGFFASRLPMWGFKVFLEGRWLRARLCCRKLSDSIFWLYYFTPRWLAGAMPCPKKVHKKYTKGKDRNRQETKTFLSYFPLFTWWMD